MQLKRAGTVAAASSVSFDDKRSTMWMIMANTGVACTATFSDTDGTNPITVTIGATNTTFVPVYGDFQKMAVTGAQVNYMVFV